METFTFFYRSQHPFSQWYPCEFEIDGVRFNCTEQYMMYGKAKLFGNEEMAAKILTKVEPRDQKALGRLVKNFDPVRWKATAKTIVYTGNYAKFTQNINLQKFLLDTAGTTLVEASPRDTIWGIGLSAENPKAHDRSTWRGTNWLGEVLTKLRDDLLAEQKN